MTADKQTFLDRNLYKTLAWTPVAQWFLWVGYSAFSDGRNIMCSNWHGPMVPCSVAEVLLYSIPNVILLNIASVGVTFGLVWPLVVGVMAFIEKVLPVKVKRVPFLWAGITVVFLFSVIAKGHYVQQAAWKAAQRAPGKKIVIIGEGGSATTIDPQF